MVILHKDSSGGCLVFFVEVTRWVFISFVILLNVKSDDYNCKIVTRCSESNGTNKDYLLII